MPLFWISLAFIAGLVLGETIPWTGQLWSIFSIAALCLWPILCRLPDSGGILSRLRWIARAETSLRVPPLLLAALLFLGAARIAFSGPDLAGGHIAAYNDQGNFRLTAVVDAPPDLRDQNTLLQMRAEQIIPLDNQPAAGKARPTQGMLLELVPGRADWQYGDRLELEGKLTTPPEGETFSYRAYLARQDIYTYLTYPHVHWINKDSGNPLIAAIYRLRDWSYREVYHLFPAPEAPLLSGILLGIDSDMPDSLADAFRDTGTAHVIAISGFNIAILAELFSKLFGKVVSRWWATLLSIFAIALYTLMVGAAPSVVRAAIMGSLSLIALQIGRRSAGLNTLGLTAALMCIPAPYLLWDASFQLSFGATLGLILYGDRFQQGFTALLERRFSSSIARKIAGPVGEYILLTLAAQLMTLPVILYHFQRLSISSLLANPLILPPQPLVMVLSGAAVLAGLVFDPLAHAIAWAAWPLSAYTNRMVETLAGIPGGVLVLGELNVWTVLLMYAAIFTERFSKRLPAAIKTAVTPSFILTVLGLLAALTWRGVTAAPDGRLRLLVMDLNGSQAILVRGPGGETLLINGSPSSRLINNQLDRWLSPFDRTLNGLLLDTPQASTLTGLAEVLESHPIEQVWWGVPLPKSRAGDRFVESLKSQQVPASLLDPGDTLSLGSEIRIETLASAETGSALLIGWQDFQALIPAGIPPDQLTAAAVGHPSLLILDPRDLEETGPEEWLAFSAQAVVATTGKTQLLPVERNWINTHPQGWISITTDGKRMWLEEK